jgi:hypothetical protein
MNKRYGTMVGLSLVLSGLTCSAQKTNIPFKQIEHEAQQSANLLVPSNEAAISRSIEAYPSSAAASGMVYSQPTYKKPRVLDSRFFLVNGLHLGLAALDVGLTQHCIAAHHCSEGNPLMPSSIAGQVGVNSALICSSVFISYRLRGQDSKMWWLAPVVGIGAHTVGAVTGFINR